MDEYKLTVSEDGDTLSGVSRGNYNDWKNVLEGVSILRVQRIALDQRRAWALAFNTRLSSDSALLQFCAVEIVEQVGRIFQHFLANFRSFSYDCLAFDSIHDCMYCRATFSDV